jgi:hypothetical protein
VQLSELEKEVFGRLAAVTKDDKFAEMIAKMIKQDPFESPTLAQVYSMSKKKHREYEPKSTANPIMEFEMEKIQLTDKYNCDLSPKRKFIRPCCCKVVENEETEVSL